MASILLTGSSGFFGKEIIKMFSKIHIINGLNRSIGEIKCNLDQEVPTFISDYDLVIHAAGKAHQTFTDMSMVDSFHKINVQGTLNLLNGLERSYMPRSFVFISSVSVYGLIEGVNINEESPLLAKDTYGISKIKAEDVVKEWCKQHNVTCTILRLPLIVGANPPGNLGAMIRGIKKGYYFNVAGGNAKKSMVLASDIAKFILKAAEIGGTYNLTDGIHPTFNELSKNISRQFGKSFVPNMPLFIANVLARIGDILGNAFPINSNKLSKITSTLTFDDSKARAAFGWKPTPVLDGYKITKDAQ